MKDLLSHSLFLIYENYGIGEKCTKERLAKILYSTRCTKFQKTCKKPMLTAFKKRVLFSLFMRGVFSDHFNLISEVQG